MDDKLPLVTPWLSAQSPKSKVLFCNWSGACWNITWLTKTKRYWRTCHIFLILALCSWAAMNIICWLAKGLLAFWHNFVFIFFLFVFFFLRKGDENMPSMRFDQSKFSTQKTGEDDWWWNWLQVSHSLILQKIENSQSSLAHPFNFEI